jgi:hypothetical protein
MRNINDKNLFLVFMVLLCFIVTISSIYFLTISHNKPSQRNNWKTFYWNDPLHNTIIHIENVSIPKGFTLLNINPKTQRWFAVDDLGKLWFSDDQKTWQRSFLPTLQGAIRWISFTPSYNVTFVASEKCLYRSIDGGKSFNLVLNVSVYGGLDRARVALGAWGFKSPYFCGCWNDSLIFIGEYGLYPSPYPESVYVYRSIDGGQTWSIVLNVTKFMEEWWKLNKNEAYYPNHNTTHVHFVAVDPYTGRIYISKGDYLGSNKTDVSLVIYSDDFGKTWKILYDAQPTAITFLPDRVIFGEDWRGVPYTVYLKSEEKILHIARNMTMFDYCFTMLKVNNVVYSAQTSHGEGAGWGGIWISSDGLSWYWAYKPKKPWSGVSIVCADKNYVYFYDQSDNLLRRMFLVSIDQVIYLTQSKTEVTNKPGNYFLILFLALVIVSSIVVIKKVLARALTLKRQFRLTKVSSRTCSANLRS